MMTMISEVTTSVITNVTTILIANGASVERSWSFSSSLNFDELQLPVYCVPHNILDTLLLVNKSGNCDLKISFVKQIQIIAAFEQISTLVYQSSINIAMYLQINEVIKTHGIVSCKAKKIETKHTKIKKHSHYCEFYYMSKCLCNVIPLLRVKFFTMRQLLNSLCTHTIFLPLSLSTPKL